MEEYIQISWLNDFVFCPKSIYFHRLYGKTSSFAYESNAQFKGKLAHKAIDNQNYSTRKNVYQGIEVYSSSFGLCGKIDIYDEKKRLLTERKKKIVTIYDGYIFQIYAQYFCLLEMGYEVEYLKLYSKDDNKSYEIALPNQDITMYEKFKKLITDIQNFDIQDKININKKKCLKCVYNLLCDEVI